MTTGTIQDRRRFTQEQLAAMASQAGQEHPIPLRGIMAGTLGFTLVGDAIIAGDHPLLPDPATVVGRLANEFRPDYPAVHTIIKSTTDWCRISRPQQGQHQ